MLNNFIIIKDEKNLKEIKGEYLKYSQKNILEKDINFRNTMPKKHFQLELNI